MLHPTIDVKLTAQADLARGIEEDLRIFKLSTSFNAETFRIRGRNLNTNYQNNSDTINGTFEGAIVEGNGDLDALVFHIANFSQRGQGIVQQYLDGTEQMWTGYLAIEAEDWIIHLHNNLNHRDKIQKLQSAGGFNITHIGQLRRLDERKFSYDEASEIISVFHHFISFIQGSWTEPFFESWVGRKCSVDMVKMESPETDAWIKPSVWIDTNYLELNLSPLFKSFQNVLNDPLSNEVIKRAISWYIKANRNEIGEEGSLVLAQTALEMLAWYIYTEAGPISTDSFSRTHEADRLRFLLREPQLPLNIPNELPNLLAAAKANDWDAAQSIGEIRNMIVHPARKKRDKLTGLQNGVVEETYTLSMWYLEMILLHQLRFSGTYHNRISGKSDRLPWA